ncbi:hypothetical protein BCR35DRAFT_335887 [Leucosporidium creatinivorum]|uniref:Uncharacterized protein n=1 Tax=Leucosporidium creatinivorum TaxID=106004 RepID=A0A1Y2D446_9BASI|nr:hypothetical protein BCR35DRAFT_335887 [Leucosporidium creatinivorum]
MSQAIKAASKLVPAGYSSLAKLQLLTQVEMAKLGIDDEEIRKGIAWLTDPKGKGAAAKGEGGKRKRPPREHDLDKPLPTREVKEVVDTDLDFDEIHAEEALIKKSVITNRAPVMTAWATIVAERLGFRRQEALSIAQVYTDLNASSKGVSLGIMDPSVLQPGAGPSQPFVDLMGRKVPVLSTQTGEWRAITKGSVADPATAFSYIQRNFRQQMGAIVGGLRVLADSFEPQELNEKGYGLYLSFRPEVDGWGKKAELRVSSILELRRFLTHAPAPSKSEGEGAGEGEGFEGRVVKIEEGEGEGRGRESSWSSSRTRKRW